MSALGLAAIAISFAPLLSNPQASATPTTAAISLSTNEPAGTLYALVGGCSNLAKATPSQIEAGQNSGGVLAAAHGAGAVSAPSISLAVSGLTPGTPYCAAIVQTDANGASNILTVAFTTPSSGGTLGTNLEGLSYYATELPFLNILKECGSNYYFTGWFTGSPPADTLEEASLQLDSDGYPLAIPQTGLASSSVYTICFRSPTVYSGGSAPPGQTAWYPPGSYTVQWTGSGTVAISGDATATLTASGQTFNVTTPSANGLFVQLTSSATGNELRNLSIVQTSLIASFNAGAIFHPLFASAVANFKQLRFMDWHNTNNELSGVSFTAAPTGTGATLSSPWTLPSGSYNLYLAPTANDLGAQAEIVSAAFTFGSTAANWSPALAYPHRSYDDIVDVSLSWGARALPSNAFYTLREGVPLEIQVALCNQVGAACYINIPLTASDAYIESLGQLVMYGQWMQQGFSGLNPTLNAYFELSNEVWNGQFGAYVVAGALGEQLWPTQAAAGFFEYNRQWYGMRVAQMAADLSQLLGPVTFARVNPVLGAQAANTFTATESLACSYYANAPCTANVRAIAIAPYCGGVFSASDEATILSAAVPLDALFATLSAQGALMSVPTGGWLGQCEGDISSYASYPGMALMAYEGGQNFVPDAQQPGWPALIRAAEYDPRMGGLYTSLLNFWAKSVGKGAQNSFDVFTDVSVINSGGAWGALESIMQPTLPLIDAPAKWQALQGYMQ